jgi:hypothetical protein
MCRSIQTLRRPDSPATDEEIRAAALQFVRKVSGYRVPSQANATAFNAAVEDIALASHRLLESLRPASGADRQRPKGGAVHAG